MVASVLAGEPLYAWRSEAADSRPASGPRSSGTSSSTRGADEQNKAEALYREAEARRWRKAMRQEAADETARRSATPRLGRASRVLCRNRLEKEIREAFHAANPRGVDSDVLPRTHLARMLRSLGLLTGAPAPSPDPEESLCTKLGLLLDASNCGLLNRERLVGFLLRASELDADNSRERSQRPAPGSAPAEECFDHLEQYLVRRLGRLFRDRLSRPAGSKTCDDARSVSSAQTSSGRPRSVSPGHREGVAPAPAVRALPSATPAMAATPSRATPVRVRPQSAGAVRGVETRQAPEDEGQPRISRCDLLYHQAIFASRETAHLEEEIKVLKQKEEMRECTFKPKLIPRSSSARRPPSPLRQPRNFEAAVERMRSAHQRRVQRREEDERISCGENYERLRRLGVQPFFASRTKRSEAERRSPLMYIDVAFESPWPGRGRRTGRIGFCEGDDPRKLARNFAKVYQLAPEAEQQLQGMLEQAYAQRPWIQQASEQAAPDGSCAESSQSIGLGDGESPSKSSASAAKGGTIANSGTDLTRSLRSTEVRDAHPMRERRPSLESPRSDAEAGVNADAMRERRPSLDADAGVNADAFAAAPPCAAVASAAAPSSESMQAASAKDQEVAEDAVSEGNYSSDEDW